MFLLVFLLVCIGTGDSEGFFVQLTDILKEGLGRYFSGRPDLKIIAEPGNGGKEGEGEEGVMAMMIIDLPSMMS